MAVQPVAPRTPKELGAQTSAIFVFGASYQLFAGSSTRKRSKSVRAESDGPSALAVAPSPLVVTTGPLETLARPVVDVAVGAVETLATGPAPVVVLDGRGDDGGLALKLARTARAALIVTVQERLEPAQSPLQLLNTKPDAAVAVIVTNAPLG
jgi:hypothetical protein